jgi:hypothetical protein
MLTVHDLVKDYDAVCSSADQLQARFGPGWPAGLTLEQNLIDLAWHQKEFQRRTSFAYTVLTPDESRVLGCVYIEPTARPGYDAEVRYWMRPEQVVSGLERNLGHNLRSWLEDCWPFANPAFIPFVSR